MPTPTFTPNITAGNIVSWILVAIGFIVGYVKLQDAQVQNIKDTSIAASTANAAKEAVGVVKDATAMVDQNLREKISNLTTDVAVIKSEVRSMRTDLGDKFTAIIDTQKELLKASQRP